MSLRDGCMISTHAEAKRWLAEYGHTITDAQAWKVIKCVEGYNPSEVRALHEEISDLREEVSKLRQTIKDLEEKLDLQDTITDLEQISEELQNVLDRLNNK